MITIKMEKKYEYELISVNNRISFGNEKIMDIFTHVVKKKKMV